MNIPPIYDPGISEEVAKYAEETATNLLNHNDYGSDWPLLYRDVRMIMGRSRVVGRNVLDDESISDGIVRAINAG